MKIHHPISIFTIGSDLGKEGEMCTNSRTTNDNCGVSKCVEQGAPLECENGLSCSVDGPRRCCGVCKKSVEGTV